MLGTRCFAHLSGYNFLCFIIHYLEGIMEIISIAICVVCSFISLSFIYSIRDFTSRGVGASRQVVIRTMLFSIFLMMVLCTPISAFHLLWIFPLIFIIGSFSLELPFSLLSIPAQFFFKLCTLGLNHTEVNKNIARFARFQELILKGWSQEEAKEQLKKEFDDA